MNILYFFWVIVLILPGETVFQICYPKNKNKISRFSIFEHLAMVIVLGFCFSSLMTLIFSLFQILTIPLLITINLIFFLLSFFLDIFNKNTINKHLLIFRIFYNLNNTNLLIKKIEKKYLFALLASVGFFLLFILVLMNFSYIPNHDIWVYTELGLDVVKFQPTIFENSSSFSWYLGVFYRTTFHSFFLGTMIMGDIASWEFIIKYIIPAITIFILILLSVDFTNKIDKKMNYLPVIFLSASYFLVNWLFYALSVGIAIILGVLFTKSFFNKEKRSYLLSATCLVFQYLFHSPTFVLFLIGIILTLLALFIIKICIKGLRKNFFNKIRENLRLYLVLVILVGVGFVMGIIFFFTPILSSSSSYDLFLNLYENMQALLIDYEVRSVPPSIFDWILGLAGPHVLILSVIAILFIVFELRKKGQKLSNTSTINQSINESTEINNYNLNVLVFFWTFLVELILICAFLPIWYSFSTISYMYYRYFIYIDLASLFLAPFAFSVIKRRYFRKKNSDKKRKRKNGNIFQLSFVVGTLIFTFLHSVNCYNLHTHYEYLPEAHILVYYWLRDNTDQGSYYCISSHSSEQRIYYHPILNDRFVLDQDNLTEINLFNDSLYDSISGGNFQSYKDFLRNGTKLLDARFAFINSSEKYTNEKIDYIVLDDCNNPNLVELMDKDDSFELKKNVSENHLFSEETYNVLLFYFK